MNIDIIAVGKSDDKNIIELTAEYLKRLNRYTKVSFVTIPDIKNSKNLSQTVQKRMEGEAILRLISDSDTVILLDERGEKMRSTEFASWLQKMMNSGVRKLCFVIGGPYGFSNDIYNRSNGSISLSEMTFSHQIIRPIFAEQLYRAFTILKNEPYHHE